MNGNIKISQLPTLTVNGSEIVPVVQDDGGGNLTTGTLSITDFGSDTNLANTNLTQTAATNRTYDINGNLLKFDNGQFEVDGSMGINIVPDGIVPAWLTIQSTDTKRPLLINSTSSANASTFQANTGYAVVGVGSGAAAIYGSQNSSGAGVWGDSASGNAVLGTSSGSTAVWANGGAVAETWNIGSSRSTKAVLQANSTTQGFLSPRMTTTQRDAIASPDTGLEIYNTTTGRKEWYNGSYWQGAPLSIFVQAAQSSPTASTTTYWGNLSSQPSATAGNRKVYITNDGVIRLVELYSRANTAGDNTAWSIYIRLNGTTDYLIQTVSVSSTERTWVNTNINIPVVAGDYIEIKMVNPAWTTSPANITFGGQIIIE